MCNKYCFSAATVIREVASMLLYVTSPVLCFFYQRTALLCGKCMLSWSRVWTFA
jgi:hypothetical protein